MGRRALLLAAVALILAVGPISGAADRDPFRAPDAASGSAATGEVRPRAEADPAPTDPRGLPLSGYDFEGQIVAAVAALALGAALRVGARAANP